MSRFALHPIENNPGRQRPGMTGHVDEAGECNNLRARNTKIEAKKAAFGEVIAGQRDH